MFLFAIHCCFRCCIKRGAEFVVFVSDIHISPFLGLRWMLFLHFLTDKLYGMTIERKSQRSTNELLHIKIYPLNSVGSKAENFDEYTLSILVVSDYCQLWIKFCMDITERVVS